MSRYSRDARDRLIGALRQEGGELARVELVMLSRLSPHMFRATLEVLERLGRIKITDENGLEIVSLR